MADTRTQIKVNTPNGDKTIEYDTNIHATLGEGFFSKVYRGSDESNNKLAVKIFKTDGSKHPICTVDNTYQNEIKMLEAVKDIGNVIQLYGHYSEIHKKYFIITPLAGGGTLTSWLDSENKKLDLIQQLTVSYDIAKGFKNLHEKGFVHRDLKPDNILLDDNRRAIIADLGSMCKIKDLEDDYMFLNTEGTPVFWSPEVLDAVIDNDRCAQSPASDVYSFGVILWCITANKKEPYLTLPSELIAFYQEIFTNRYREKISTTCSDPMNTLISTCWDHNPEERPSDEKVCEVLNAEITKITGAPVSPSLLSDTGLFSHSSNAAVKQPVNLQPVITVTGGKYGLSSNFVS